MKLEIRTNDCVNNIVRLMNNDALRDLYDPQVQKMKCVTLPKGKFKNLLEVSLQYKELIVVICETEKVISGTGEQ
jgi:hypothetical protein